MRLDENLYFLERPNHQIVKFDRVLYEVELPYFPKIIKDGNIWVIDRDEEDRTVIKKLIIKNYSSMKY